MASRFKGSIRNRFIFLADLILIIVCVFCSYILRLELGYTFYKYLPSAYWMIGVSLVIKPAVYYFFGLYRRLWNYASMNEMKLILIAVTCASAVVSAVMVILASANVFFGFPRLVLIIDWILSMIAVGGVRFSVRIMYDLDRKNSIKSREKMKRALIIGAGDAGALVLKEIQKNPQLNVHPVGFIDDDPKKMNQSIYGVKVIGTVNDIRKIIDRYAITDVFFAIPSAPGRVVRVVSDSCREKEVNFRTMPGIYELLGGKISISKLREVEITDLLRRDPVKLDAQNIGSILTDKIVLVSGAGGSIGRELCNQIARWNPARIILLGHGENSIFETLLDLHENYPALSIKPQIADIRDQDRLREIFQEFHPDIVFHAAAHKHVPLMEFNGPDAITNNVFGTWNMAHIANENGVERFVMISTDKAVRPVNIMGATKRIAENIVLNESAKSAAEFTVVRFGNVLGSRGSVVPIFQEQIKKGGPVTITHPEMKRYFMTIPEAVYLVLEAAGLATKEETFVLNMGKQVRILELAEDLIRLSGLEPGKDIEIKFTGIRTGEKLSEDLWNEGQILEPTLHPDIFKLERDDLMDDETLSKVVRRLLELAKEGDDSAIRKYLNEVIPDANINEREISDIFTF
ncbi:MAG TPA: nucleoside-diphosphate sugar epimerase/dehydratase [Flexilinea sp.]|nr:nucleoside-diphosphate sugar epimerase/dehydratase [Flexilinea sp.]